MSSILGYVLVGALGAGAASLSLTAGVVAVAVGAAAASAWSRRNTRQELAAVERYADQLAAGDLSSTAPPSRPGSTRGIQMALVQLAVNIRSLVADTRIELEQMNLVSAEIARGNGDLAQRTESQAASLEQAAASMEQISATVRNSSATAHRANDVAGELGEVSRRSAAVVHSVTETMGGIARSSTQIGEIISVIDGIAFQTNILALNAAVESARAGEHGRGFAVVASEVRALAQRCSEAAREIKRLITASTEQVEAGERQTDAARTSIDTTLQSVEHFAEMIGAIDRGAQEQQLGISQIHEAIQQMDGFTQQNASLVVQLADSARQMLAQSEEVAAALRVFRIDAGSRVAADAVALRRAARIPA